MLKLLIPVMFLLLLIPVFAVDPIPPGTPHGRVYVRVTDCVTGNLVVGASVSLDNPTHRQSSVTNSTGVATLDTFAWFYTYYVNAPSYRIESGVRRFSIGEVFQICLVPEAAGFWRIVATVIAWQGDIHAGGKGWAIIRLKNLEAGIFNITEFQIWVDGYNSPAITYTVPRGVVVGRLVERDVNITVNPKPDIPVGRLKAELKFRAVFTAEDGRKIGPLTVSTDLDYVVIAPYRTFTLKITDYWGLNPVPDALVEMQATLAGAPATFLYRSNEKGEIEIQRMSEGVYFMRIFYLSPYDDRVHLINQLFPLLADLAKTPTVKTYVYEAHVNVKDLANRALETEVYLNNFKASSMNGLAKFFNIPPGDYTVKVEWRGVEVFEGSLTVREPLVKNSPGGFLEAVAQVGNIGVRVVNAAGKPFDLRLKISLKPFGGMIENVTSAVFERLPKGDYVLEIQAYNLFKDQYVVVGEKTLRIPENHGENVVAVDVFDLDVQILDYAGRKLENASVTVEGKQVPLRDGKISLKSITAGAYGIEAVWKGFKVLNTVVVFRSGTNPVLRADIYAMQVNVVGIDGHALVKGTAVLQIGQMSVERTVVNGSVYFEEVPAGRHKLSIYLDQAEVFSEDVQTAEKTIVVAKAGYVEISVKDQSNNPVAGVSFEIEKEGAKVTGADGKVRLGQKPAGSYKYSAKYKGFTVFQGLAKSGETTEVVLPLYVFKVVLLNEFDRPVDGWVEVSRDDVLVGKFFGSEVTYVSMPPGMYTVRALVGTKNVETRAVLASDGQTFVVKLPVALVLGDLVLSLQDLFTILLPIGVVILAVVSAVALKKTTSIARSSHKGRV
ncbi:MAG: hypothetical protein QXY84_06175 [Candidatus Caldarchaeum sp.]